MLDEVKKCILDAKRNKERRLIVLAGNAREMFKLCINPIEREFKGKKLCFVSSELNGNAFVEILRNTDMECEFFHYDASEDLLGTTFDILVMDMRLGVLPNDFGRLISIVRGPGIILLLVPEMEKFKNIITLLHKKFVVYPYEFEDARRNFNRWFVEKLFESRGVAIFENGEIIKRITPKKKSVLREKIEIPEDRIFDRKIYKLCLTSDQVNFLSMSGDILKRRRGVFVLTSHRGRGKSSVLGLMLAAISKYLERNEKYETFNVNVTSPRLRNVLELFRFFKRGCKKLGMEFREKSKNEITSERIRIEYLSPNEVRFSRADLLIVDEAASIPIKLLLASLKVSPIVFYSTTIHGYEGCGRVFQIRFLEKLRKKTSNFLEYEMTEPIRYSKDDEIEKFLFRVLLLDAEPPDIDPEINLGDIRYERVKIENLLFRNEKLLKEIFGIFINAHYRNNPNDFGVICDAPHHSIRILKFKNIPIASIQLAEEGSLGEVAYEMYLGRIYSGNLIPDRVIKHYRIPEFGRFKGKRIVRIAVHPSLFGRGIGSKALKFLENELRDNGYDWIGASFGATPKLLNFWLKNNYRIIHISPMENPVTGEFSTIVIKPLSDNCKKYLDMVEDEFRIKFIDSLVDPYFNLETDLALKILSSFKTRDEKLEMSEIQWKRFFAYAFSSLTLETCRDVAYKIARHYFLSNKKPRLSRLQEEILIAKVLQAKPWSYLRKEFKKKSTFLMVELRETIRKLAEYYGNGIYDKEERKKMLQYRRLIRDRK